MLCRLEKESDRAFQKSGMTRCAEHALLTVKRSLTDAVSGQNCASGGTSEVRQGIDADAGSQ